MSARTPNFHKQMIIVLLQLRSFFTLPHFSLFFPVTAYKVVVISVVTPIVAIILVAVCALSKANIILTLLIGDCILELQTQSLHQSFEKYAEHTNGTNCGQGILHSNMCIQMCFDLL